MANPRAVDCRTRLRLRSRRPLAALAMAGALFGGVVSVYELRPIQADLIKLKHGGELRGQVVPENKSLKPADAAKAAGEARPPGLLTVESTTGAVIEIERDSVEFVTPRMPLIEEYESLDRRTPRTPDDRWQLAEWCRKRGLAPARQEQLELIVELDPDHAAAHRALGHEWQNGSWIDRDELMAARGLVKHKNRYITPEELALLEQSDADRRSEREWFTKLRIWTTWLNGGGQRAADGMQELRSIDDPSAGAAIQRYLLNDRNPEMRLLGLDVLAGINSSRTVGYHVKRAIHDERADVRQHALATIPANQHLAAARVLAKELKSSDNVAVRRAASALSLFGNAESVPPLIDALVTTHSVKVAAPAGNMGISVTGDGNFAGNNVGVTPEVAGMLMLNGGEVVNVGPAPPMRVVTVRRPIRNPEVLETLEKLTGGQNCGYDKRMWKLWWGAQKHAGK